MIWSISHDLVAQPELQAVQRALISQSRPPMLHANRCLGFACWRLSIDAPGVNVWNMSSGARSRPYGLPLRRQQLTPKGAHARAALLYTVQLRCSARLQER